MRRKRSSTIHHAHQANMVNVHAVVVGLDGVGKSGELILPIKNSYGQVRNLNLNLRHHFLQYPTAKSTTGKCQYSSLTSSFRLNAHTSV